MREEPFSPEDILAELRRNAKPGNLEGMARYGISTGNRLGVAVPVMRKLARKIGRRHRLALQLWKTGIAEARILASMIAVPDEMTGKQMDDWAADFNSWDVCDQVCMNLFDKSPHARKKIREWSRREEEFVKRAAFALLACIAWHDKKAPDADFLAFLPLLERGALDERNFVKKAVSWALRHIGKRNEKLRSVVIETAGRLRGMESKSALWVGRDVGRELE